MKDFEVVANGSDQPPEGYPGSLALDPDKYRHHVESFDITEDQKLALLQTLWDIMRSFVELGYGVESVNRFLPAMREFSTESQTLEVQKEHHKRTTEFNETASDASGGRTIQK